MNFPRQARITKPVWLRYGCRFQEMGLSKPEFQAIDGDKEKVVVDPADLNQPKDRPFTVARGLVEFLEES